MKVSALSNEQLALLLQDFDWNANSEAYAEGFPSPDFFDENEFNRSDLLEGLGISDEDEVSATMLEDLRVLQQD